MNLKINFSSIFAQLLLLMFVIVWLAPTFGLFISSFRDKDHLAISGWWTSLMTTEINEIHRTNGKDKQIKENGYYLIKDNIFDNIEGKKISSFGVTSKKINEFNVGDTAVLKDKSLITVYENGDYEWKSEKEFKKKKGRRIFITATSPPNFSLNNYKEVLFKEGLGQAFLNTIAVALPSLMETNYSNIEFQAGGLNHFSILLNVKYKDTGKDGYPIIRKKFDSYYSNLVNDHEGFISKPGAERGVFRKLFKDYNYLPITTDSHLGEYLQWAYSVADHDAILHFYDNYKIRCLNFYNDAEHYNHFFDKDNLKCHERVIPIIDAIIGDTKVEEAAVNVPNLGFIDCLPDKIVVEVPAKLDKAGVHGIKLDHYPKGFGNLLNSQVGVIEMTTEAILKKSKHDAYLALLADPVVDNATNAEKLLNNMIGTQEEFLGYLN